MIERSGRCSAADDRKMGERRDTPQSRCGRGFSRSLQQAFPPDQAAEDVLGRLIEQIDKLDWPRSPPAHPNGG